MCTILQVKHDTRWWSTNSHFGYGWLQVRSSLSRHRSEGGMCAGAGKQQSEHTQSLIQVNLSAWWKAWCTWISPSGNEAAICLLEFSQRRLIISRFPILLGCINIWRKEMLRLLLQKFLLLVRLCWSLQSAGISEIPTANQIFILSR